MLISSNNLFIYSIIIYSSFSSNDFFILFAIFDSVFLHELLMYQFNHLLLLNNDF
jgi:hypothetical protein